MKLVGLIIIIIQNATNIIMNDITFSWTYSKYDPFGYERDGHSITQMTNATIYEMPIFEYNALNNDFKNRVQMANGTKRVVKDTPFDVWNGCVFIDIDYKNWVKDNQQSFIAPITILNNTFKYLCDNYTHNVYYGELSRSGCGFHYIFYYDCERSREQFDYYSKLTRMIVERTFEQCNYGEIIHHKKVFDTCTNSFCQICYITRNNEMFNQCCDGKITEYEDIIIQHPNKHKQYETHYSKQKKWNYQLKERNDDIKKVEYINHYERWRLFNSLSMIFDDDNDLRNEWERCARMIPQQNGHTTNYYINCPYSINDWNRNKTKDEYVDIKLLAKFGYDVTMTRKAIIYVEDLIALLEQQ